MEYCLLLSGMKEKELNVLSLFDGMACGRIALERAGLKVKNYIASEIDKYAITIAKKNYPDIKHIGDVSKVSIYYNAETDTTTISYECGFFRIKGKIDIIIGGSPCQGFSNAGAGLNFTDPRSALFFEYVRLFNQCREFNDNLIYLLENVCMKKEWAEVISKFLSVMPIQIDSALVSAQTRNRLYWTNIPNVKQPKDMGIYWCDVFEENGTALYYTEKSFNWLFKDPKRKAKYKEYGRFDKVKMQMLEKSHHKGYSNQRCFGIIDNKGTRYITPIECERLQNVPDNYTQGVSNSQRYMMLGNGWNVNTITHIFNSI